MVFLKILLNTTSVQRFNNMHSSPLPLFEDKKYTSTLKHIWEEINTCSYTILILGFNKL